MELVASAPRRKLTDGIWSLILVTAPAVEGEARRSQKVDGRLLVQGRRPLVLLWGVDDRPSITPVKKTVPPARQRAAAAAGRGLDKALSVLPPERAASARERLRATARRVLP